MTTLTLIWTALTLALSPATAATPTPGERIAASAQWHLDHQPELSRDDCSGAVQQILERAGFPRLEPLSTAGFWMGSFGVHHKEERPDPGDIVFFDGTYNKNDDPRVTLDDQLTHIGVVLDIDHAGNMRIVHRSNAKRTLVTTRMNLDQAHNTTLNDVLSRSAAMSKDERRTASLFHGFVTVDDLWFEQTQQPVGRPSDDPARLALDGDRLLHRDIDGLTCNGLWAVRNTVFARHGYAFQSRAAQVYFRARLWYDRDDGVHTETVARMLTNTDRANIDLVVNAEYENGCRSMAQR